VRILSLDPGTANFGYAVVDIARHPKKAKSVVFRVLENGKCPSTVCTLKSSPVLREEMSRFEYWLGSLVSEYEPDAVAAERFMTRGIKGPTVECVNIMIGMVTVLVPRPFKIMPAATWKNAVNRSGVDLKSAYKLTSVSPHQLDASLIGLYTGCAAYHLKDFGELDLQSVMPKLFVNLEETATVPLINRKLDR
jgi:hypothetical protein